MPTNQQLEAANARLGDEIAALRELLAAASAAASLPMPASDGDMDKYREAAVLRTHYIAEFCQVDEAAVSGASILRARAKILRDAAEAPLPYAPEPDVTAGDFGAEIVSVPVTVVTAPSHAHAFIAEDGGACACGLRFADWCKAQRDYADETAHIAIEGTP
jgi:hypothetical protein